MSHEVRRVPLDFEWPLKKVWEGYLMPRRLREDPCPECTQGYSPHAQYLHDLWYGKVPFRPEGNGSMPHGPDSAEIHLRAVRNVDDAPEYYGSGEAAVRREAERLAAHFDGAWSHHLNDADVAALVAADRLHDFTHTWIKGTGWVKNDPLIVPSAEQVNRWSLNGFGHDSVNAWICVRARCERDGVPAECFACEGHASVEAYEGQRAEAEAWQSTDPPAGEGWQLWETVSEGSPVTPVFPTADGLISHLVEVERYRLSAAQQLVSDGGSVGTMMITTMEGRPVALATDRDADILDSLSQED
jgi:hypothetical protein